MLSDLTLKIALDRIVGPLVTNVDGILIVTTIRDGVRKCPAVAELDSLDKQR